jgi:hypothetical protein
MEALTPMKKFYRKHQPPPARPKPPTAQTLPNGEPLAKGWNVGGTLHKSTIEEWRAATFGNALATCADWVVAIAELAGKPTPTGGLFRVHIDIADGDVYLLYCWELYQSLNQAAHRHAETAPTQEMHVLAMGAASALGWFTVEVTNGAG